MESTVSKRWQTVIPAAIRRRHKIQEGDMLEWIDDGETIRVVPITSDPVRALRGRAKGQRLTEQLLAARAEDRKRERRPG
jgi:AbrB family looped-hinge helix DNA binding protein